MEKKVEFYRIHLEQLPLLINYDSNLAEKFIQTLLRYINENEPYTIQKSKDENTSVRIEVLEINRDYMFGILGKLEDLKDGVLKRLRKKEDKEIVDPESQPIDFLVENYTYFYVRFSDMKCAVITNNAAPKFRRHFNNYLKTMTEGKITELETILVVTMLDNQIQYKLNRFENLRQIKMIYDDSSEIGNRMVSLSDVYGISQYSLREATIDISFYGAKLPEKAKKLLSDNEIVESNFKRFEMYGEGDDEEQIEIELVKKILTRRVTINIDDRYLRHSDDLDKIKQALAGAFPIK